jgi:hypothetical protein
MMLRRLNACFVIPFILAALLGSFSFGTYASAATPSPMIFDHIEDGTIYFKSGTSSGSLQSMNSRLYELVYLGTLYPKQGDPYFLVSGRSCRDCLEDRTIYALRPSGGKPSAFIYPGKIFEPKQRSLVLDSKAFFGKCIANRGDVYVVFQKERIDRRKGLQNSVFIAEAKPEYFEEHLLENQRISLDYTLRMVKSKQCHEVSGRNRMILSQPLDLKPRVNTDNDPDEEDSPENGESKPEELDP